jgi:PncC family amidohydrolase
VELKFVEAEDLALNIQKKLIEQHKTIAFAESCTGGFLSHLITSNPGASECFLGSFITYSNALKMKILGVKEATLAQYGAVSKETVEEMLSGVLRLTEADFAIAVSGVAGPDGGTEKTPVGTVFYALAEKGNPIESGSFYLSGDRKNIIATASYRILTHLYRKLI